MNESTALATVDYAPVSAKALQQQVNVIQEAMAQVMEKGVHFGTVPGCGPKPTLLKPGAEKICLMFRLAASFQVNKTELGNGHREYEIVCTLKDVHGREVGQGVGSCSTMEKKYRYRRGGNGQQVENPDIADVYNTVLKIGKKRAHVDATLTTTAASDIFTQDIEDIGVADYSGPQAPRPAQNGTAKAAPAEGVDHDPGYEESQDSGDLIAYAVPYEEKDQWKPLLSKAGHKWNSGAKCWQGGKVIPEMEQYRV